MISADQNTLFIIGNGPSLKGIDLKALSPYATLGMNAAYRYWREIDWRPRYYACLDEVVGLSHRNAIVELLNEGRIQTFLLRSNLIDALGDAAYDRRVINFDAFHNMGPPFSGAPTITTGSHATLWGATLGFRKIILLGIDGRYKEIVAGSEHRGGIVLEVASEKENPNYFFDGYQKTGDRYCIPNPRPGLHVGAWQTAAHNLKPFDCKVYNANAKSEVRSFSFINLDDFLSEGSEVTSADEDAKAFPLQSSKQGIGDRWYRLHQFATSQWRWALIPLALFIGASIAAAAVASDLISTLPWLIMAFFLCTLSMALLFQRFTLGRLAIDITNRISTLEAHIKENRRQEIIALREKHRDAR